MASADTAFPQFPEMMAEMRRPVDFWKVIVSTITSMSVLMVKIDGLPQICAECLIMFLYMGYGVTVYSLQGQYTLPYGASCGRRRHQSGRVADRRVRFFASLSPLSNLTLTS